MPSVEIFVVSYRNDYEFFSYGLRSVRKFGQGFAGLTVVVPTPDVPLFKEICDRYEAKLFGFDERPGLGRIHQAVLKCHTDEYVSDADYVFHIDSDVHFSGPVRVDDFFIGDNPIYPMEPYGKLYDPANRLVCSAFVWKLVTEHLFECAVPYEYMRCQPTVYPIWLYRQFRDFVLNKKSVTLDEFVFGLPNFGVPHWTGAFSEFNCMGYYSHTFHADKFHWIDLSSQSWVPKHVVQLWGAGGLTQEIKKRLETVLQGYG